jgi:carboxylesterase type B
MLRFMRYKYYTNTTQLGAFGFLAGTTVEKEGTPNAGFHDQRAVQQWIKDYASLFGGNPDDLSLWGESAGAGSIMHHLTAYGGKEPVLFKKAVILSPAYDALIDRKGALEKNMQSLLATAGCAGKSLACLRALSFKQMKAAQEKYIDGLSPGKFGFGYVFACS